MGFKPSAPVSIDTMLADQTSRWNSNNYDTGLGWMGDTTGSFDNTFDYDIERDNPFFTSTNQPGNNIVTSRQWSHQPFLWSGDNDSLRDVYKQAYDQHYGGDPTKVTIKQNQTWQGPEIRPTYDEEDFSLSMLGTPNYWQDNNDNEVYDFEADSMFSSIGTGQVDMTPPEEEEVTPSDGEVNRHSFRKSFRNNTLSSLINNLAGHNVM